MTNVKNSPPNWIDVTYRTKTDILISIALGISVLWVTIMAVLLISLNEFKRTNEAISAVNGRLAVIEQRISDFTGGWNNERDH